MASTVAERLWTADGIRLIIKGPGFRRNGKRFSVAQPFVRIGRFAGIDIPIDHPEVSRWHVYLHRMPEGIFFVDLGSRTGLVYRGKPCTHGWLTGSEPLQMAGYTIFVTENVPTPTVEPLARIPLEEDELLPVSLTFGSQEGETTSHPIKRRLTLLGRSAPSNLRLSDPTIARAHLAIYRTKTDAWMVNLVGASAFHENHSFVAAHLRDQDTFEVGNFSILTRIGPEAVALRQSTESDRPDSGESILTADFYSPRHSATEDISTGPVSPFPEDSSVSLGRGGPSDGVDSDRGLSSEDTGTHGGSLRIANLDAATQGPSQPLATSVSWEREDAARNSAEIERLRDDLNKLRLFLSQTETERDRAATEESRLTEQLNLQFAQLQELDALKQAHEAAVIESQSLRSQGIENVRLRAEVEELARKFADLQGAGVESDALRAAAADLPLVVRERDELKGQNETLTRELETLRSTISTEAKNAEREQLTAEIERLRNQLRQSENLVAENQGLGEEIASEFQNLRLQHESEIQALQIQVAEKESLSARIAELEFSLARLGEVTAAKETLEQSQEDLKQQIAGLTESLRVAEAKAAERDRLVDEFAQLQQRFTDSEQKFAEADLKLTSVTADWEQRLAQQTTQWETRLASNFADLEQLNASKVELEQAFDSAKREVEQRMASAAAEAERKVGELVQQLSERDQAIARMKQNQVKATELITERNRAVADLKLRCESLEGERTQLQIHVQELSQRFGALASSDQTNASLIAGHTATIATLEQQLRKATEEQSHLHKQVEDLQSRAPLGKGDSEARIAELERIVNEKVRKSELEHQRLLDELSESQSDLVSMSKEMQSLAELLNQKRSDTESAAITSAPATATAEPGVGRLRSEPRLDHGPNADSQTLTSKEGDGEGRPHSKVAATLLHRAENLEQRRQMILNLVWVGFSFIAILALAAFFSYTFLF